MKACARVETTLLKACARVKGAIRRLEISDSCPPPPPPGKPVGAPPPNNNNDYYYVAAGDVLENSMTLNNKIMKVSFHEGLRAR